MRKNVLIFWLLFLPIFLLANNDATPLTAVELQGMLRTAQTKSASAPLEVVQQENQIVVNFFTNLGVLDVSIVNSKGQVVYNRGVNTSVQSCLMIPTINWREGNYQIIISDMFGGELRGNLSVSYLNYL